MHEGPVSIQPAELPDLLHLLNQVFRDEGGDMGKDYPRHLGPDNCENIRVIKENGKIVSHVGVSIRPVLLGGIPTAVAGVGAVATHPGARGKGYASMLMRDAVERSVAQGADVMLISGDEGVYKRMHAAYCGEYPRMRLPANFTPAIQADVEFREAAFEDIDEIIRLRQLNATRYLLPREDIEALFHNKWVMDKPSQWWVASSGERVEGFAAVYKENNVLHLLDWSGRRDAFPSMCHWLINKYGVDSLDYIAQDDSAVPLSMRRFIDSPAPFEGTVLVIEANRFLSRARDMMIERLGKKEFNSIEIKAEKQSVLFAAGGEEVCFDNGGELARLFFDRNYLQNLEKKGLRAGLLYDMLKTLFPIPLVWYGLGYV